MKYAVIGLTADGDYVVSTLSNNEAKARKFAAAYVAERGVSIGLYSLIDTAEPAGVVWKGASAQKKAKPSEPKRRWTPEEDAALFNYTAEAGNMTMTELCKALNRTERAVKARMKALRG